MYAGGVRAEHREEVEYEGLGLIVESIRRITVEIQE